ncbi:MAG: LemA family protein [Bacteroidales bacterium]
MSNILIIVLTGVAVIILGFIVIYNSLINKKNQIANAEGSIDTMLKKRFDLIPNLVDTCKVYLSHEKEVFNHLAELRTQATAGKMDITAMENLDKSVSKSVGNLLLMAENYPELKSSNNFIQLQAAWNETEDQISASRRFYNSAITDYNNSVQMFPSSIVAAIFGMKSREVFKAAAFEKENVSAKSLFNS